MTSCLLSISSVPFLKFVHTKMKEFAPMECKVFPFTEKDTFSEALRKHAYSNKLKILPPKNEKFPIKILIFFIFLLKT